MSQAPLTVEQKAELFDRLCKTIPRANFSHYRDVEVVDTSNREPGSTLHRPREFRRVKVYSWVLLSDDEPDFEASMRRYLTKSQPKEMK